MTVSCGSGQRLVEVGDEVGVVIEADRQAPEADGSPLVEGVVLGQLVLGAAYGPAVGEDEGHDRHREPTTSPAA